MYVPLRAPFCAEDFCWEWKNLGDQFIGFSVWNLPLKKALEVTFSFSCDVYECASPYPFCLYSTSSNGQRPLSCDWLSCQRVLKIAFGLLDLLNDMLFQTTRTIPLARHPHSFLGMFSTFLWPKNYFFPCVRWDSLPPLALTFSKIHSQNGKCHTVPRCHQRKVSFQPLWGQFYHHKQTES